MPSTAPRQLADQAVLAARLARLSEVHVAPVNALVDQIRRARGNDLSVPYVDPDGPGVGARVLVLLEAPGPRALGPGGGRSRSGSGLLSSDNDDDTAANVWRFRSAAGLVADDLLFWNVVPWYLGTSEAITSATGADIEAGVPYLRRLVGLLPDLALVMPLGRAAQIGWASYCVRRASSQVVIPAPHPSARAVNRYPHVRGQLSRAFGTAALLLRADRD